MPGHTAHIGVNGHGIIIQNNDHRLFAHSRIVQAFVGHAAGGSTVAQHGNYLMILIQEGSCPGHTQRNGHRAGCMTGNECIGITFHRLRETGHTAKLTQMVKIRLASGQDLMDIRLVTHIKYQAVFTCIKHGLDGNGQFHHTQIGCQVAAGFGNPIDKKFPDLAAEGDPFVVG